MRLTIDTEKDSRETIIKAINFLKGVIGNNVDVVDNHGSYANIGSGSSLNYGSNSGSSSGSSLNSGSGSGQDASFAGELMGFLDADSVKTSGSEFDQSKKDSVSSRSGFGFSLNEELSKKSVDFDDSEDLDDESKDRIRLVPY